MHRGDQIEVVKVPTELLAALGQRLDRNNRWDLSHHDGQVTVVIGGEAFEAPLERVPLQPPAT